MAEGNRDETVKISAIMTAHGEGAMAAVSYKSLLAACARAESGGFLVEKIVVLDRATAQTRSVFADLGSDTFVLETDFGDQGLARNEAVLKSTGDFVAFIDGDDLWGENWLYEAAGFLMRSPPETIAHPEFDWFFQGVSSIIVVMDQDDPLFDENFLRFGNYWDAMCMASRDAYVSHPYCQRQIKDGFAFEDWHWNCRTYEAGYRHKVVTDTIHFKRRRADSQTLEASSSKALMPLTSMTSFQWSRSRTGS